MCLATDFPEIAKQWHPVKNNDLTPFDVTHGSHRKAWWICSKGHEWNAQINSRSRGTNCPYCSGNKVNHDNCLHTLYLYIAEEWHPSKNGILTPYNVTIGSRKKIWWKCKTNSDHEWQTTVNHRTRGLNCPICSGQKVTLSNCLATLRPDLAKEWHHVKNENITPYDVTVSSGKKVWWKCELDNEHEWKTSVNKRTIGRKCPCCSGKKVALSNCLLTIRPDLAKEWNPNKNGNLTPLDVTSSSGKKRWWICENEHEWQATISSRKKGTGCPICKESKGEKFIAGYLDKINVTYSREENGLSECRLKKSLIFDFAALYKNQLYLIEYNGKQHYHHIKGWMPYQAFLDIQKRDEIKINFCKENNIPLLIIPYWKFNNIPILINEFLKIPNNNNKET